VQWPTITYASSGEASKDLEGRSSRLSDAVGHLPGLLNGSCVVTPLRSGQTFSPGRRTVSVDGAGSGGNDFAMVHRTSAG